MKIKQARFSVPDCVFDEPMPAKMRGLLVFLFRESRQGGECRPGYKAMREAMRDTADEKGCNATVRRYLKALKKEGWIFHMRRTQSVMFIYLQIPFRLRVKTDVKAAFSVVSP